MKKIVKEQNILIVWINIMRFVHVHKLHVYTGMQQALVSLTRSYEDKLAINYIHEQFTGRCWMWKKIPTNTESILQDKEIIKCGGTWGLTVQVREGRDQEVNLSGLQPFVLLWTSRAAQ